MPIPNEIDNTSHLLTTTMSLTFTGPNNGREITREFGAYLELYFQGKHDAKVRTYCRQNQIECRNRNGTQVNNNEDDLETFYRDMGNTAIQVAKGKLIEAWEGGKTFEDGEKMILAVQSIVQNDGYQYDVSLYYTSDKVIYVTYHCYPA